MMSIKGKGGFMTNAIRRWGIGSAGLLAVALALPLQAAALNCTDIGGTDAAGTCTLSSVYACTGATSITIPDNLVITSSGAISCDGTSGSSPTAGSNLTLTVGGDLTVAGAISSNGGAGAAGGSGQPGTAGAGGGAIQITVTGNMTLDSGSFLSPAIITALGGPGGAGGAASISGNGGAGATGAAGGSVTIKVDLAYSQNNGQIIDVSGGAGGPGGAGANNGTGGNGANAGAGGSVTIFSCNTYDDGIIGSNGGAGGAGGAGAGTGNGGNNGSGANGGTIDEESGTNLTFGADAPLRVALGGTEGTVGAGGSRGGVPGTDVGDPGNGGIITFNHCPSGSFIGLANVTTVLSGGGGSGTEPAGTDGTLNTLDTAPCCPCSIKIEKTVAPDVNCDGTADSAFVDSVTVNPTECVVYQICVTNTGDVDATVPPDVPQPVDGVQVSDTHLGVVTASFGTIQPGAANQVCKQIPAAITAAECTGPGGTCVCSAVQGTNTSAIDATTALCGADQTQACDTTLHTTSVCSDTADSACNTPTPTPTDTPTPTPTDTPTPTPTDTPTPTPTDTPTPTPTDTPTPTPTDTPTPTPTDTPTPTPTDTPTPTPTDTPTPTPTDTPTPTPTNTQAGCEVDVDKSVCSVAQPAEGCTGGAQAITIKYIGTDITPSTLTVKGSGGRTVEYDFTGSLVNGTVLTCPPQAGAPYTCVGINPALTPGNENGFTIDATASGCTTCKLGTTVSVYVNGSATAQEIFHTSCSCPDSFGTNLIVGAPMCLDANSPDNSAGTKGTPSPLWQLVALRDPSLGVIGEPDPSVCNQDFALPAAPCSIKDNKLTELTFEYVGAEGKANNCANQQNSQKKDKRPCSGTANDTQPVALTVTDGPGGVTFLNLPPSGPYNLGDSFTVRSVDGLKTGDGTPASKKNFPGDLRIKVYVNPPPSDLKKTIEDQKFKSDCKEGGINIGDVFGGFQVTGITSTKGGVYTQCIPVEYRYAVTNTAAGSSPPLWLCDDQVTSVCQVNRNVCTSNADCDQNDPNDTCGPIAGNVTIGAGATEHYTADTCVAPATENTVVAQTQACPAVQSSDPAFCAIAGAQLPPPPPPTPGPCQKPLRLRLQYTGQQVGTCDGTNDVTLTVTASSGPSATLQLDCLQPGDVPVGANGWTLDGGSTTLATVVTVSVLDNGTPPQVCSGGNVTGTNPCTTIDQCKIGTPPTLDHEVFASYNVAITKGCVEETEKFHTSCSCSANPDVNLVIGHQMCLDTGSGTNDSGVKGEPSHLWKLEAREPL
jgi:hypothetical protein